MGVHLSNRKNLLFGGCVIAFLLGLAGQGAAADRKGGLLQRPPTLPVFAAESPSSDIQVDKEKSPDVPSPAEAQAEKDKAEEKTFRWSFRWKEWEGLHFDVAQKIKWEGGEYFSRDVDWEIFSFGGKIGAQGALDGAAYVSDIPGVEDDIKLRRVKLYAKGDIATFEIPASYKIQFGLSGDRFLLDEVFLRFDFPHLKAREGWSWIGYFTAGFIKTPMSLDALVAFRDLTLMEQGSPVQAFAPGIKFGLQTGNIHLQDRLTWRLGIYSDVQERDLGDASNSLGRIIGRLTWLPVYKEIGFSREVLHLGVALNQPLVAGDVRYQARPESYVAPYLVDTGDISANSSTMASAEAASVKGPLTLQGEYFHAAVNPEGKPSLDFSGFYLMGSRFLTGESRPYNKVDGLFDKVVPKRNFSFRGGGLGAWEVALRYSYLDLSDRDVGGGVMHLLMGGLNGYLNPVAKIRFNGGYGNIYGGRSNGPLFIFQTRFEINY